MKIVWEPNFVNRIELKEGRQKTPLCFLENVLDPNLDQSFFLILIDNFISCKKLVFMIIQFVFDTILTKTTNWLIISTVYFLYFKEVIF